MEPVNPFDPKDSVAVAAAFDDGRLYIHRYPQPSPNSDGVPCHHMTVVSRPAGGSIVNYTCKEGSDVWSYLKPYDSSPWPELDREVERRANIKIETPRFTTNVREANVTCPRRVKLTATPDGSLVWAELYSHAGELLGCGPSIDLLDRDLREACADRLLHVPAASPMYWTRVS